MRSILHCLLLITCGCLIPAPAKASFVAFGKYEQAAGRIADTNISLPHGVRLFGGPFEEIKDNVPGFKAYMLPRI
jgi:hypothetical protein